MSDAGEPTHRDDPLGNRTGVDELELAQALSRVNAELFGASPVATKIGRFTVLDRLGAGAFGVVYAAYDPDLDRKVAIKVVKPGTGERNRLRLHREARALARLSHPNVVTVHEVSTVDEQVYVAMEFIDGVTLRQWLAEPRTWRDVRRVFLRAGRGLTAAHNAQILHRDFKPDNVMTRGPPRYEEVIVLDFGLARPNALPDREEEEDDDDDPARVLVTRTGVAVGTPAYMAPELHAGEASTAAADQYAFCVSLYEGLFGERPFLGKSRFEVLSAMRSGPTRPSTPGDVPGWLTDIVLRGLAPDPQQRWPDMASLLAAMRRDPMRKWRRLAFVAVPAAATAGVVAALDHDDACAHHEADVAQRWNDDVATELSAVFADAAPTTLPHVRDALDAWTGRWIDARTATCRAESRGAALAQARGHCLDEALAHLDTTMTLLREGDATVLRHAVDTLPGAEEIEYCETLATAPELAGPEHTATRSALIGDLARARGLTRAGRTDEAIEITQRVHDQAEALELDDVRTRALLQRGRTQLVADAVTASVQSLSEAVVEAQRSENHFLQTDAWISLTSALIVDARLDEAERTLALAEVSAQRFHRAPTLWTLDLETARGSLATERGRADAAVAHQRTALGLARETGERPHVIRVLSGLATAELAAGKTEAALAHFEEVVEGLAALYGDDHTEIGTQLSNIAACLHRLGRREEAEAALRRGIAILRTNRPADDPSLTTPLFNLASLLVLRDPERSLPAFAEAERAARGRVGEVHPAFANILRTKGHALRRLGRYAEALEAYQSAYDARTARLGAEHPGVATDLTGVATAKRHLGRTREAVEHYRRAIEVFEAATGSKGRRLALPLTGLALALCDLGEEETALVPAERALAIAREHELDKGSVAMAMLAVARARHPTDRATAIGLAKDALTSARGIDAEATTAIETWLAVDAAQP